MSKYILISPHKCGSSILRKIILATGKKNTDKKYDSFLLSDGHVNHELCFSRQILEDQDYDQDDNYVFVIRNPISICISMFYSFGYTHTIPPFLTECQKKKFEERRGFILNSTLEEFVSLRLENQCNRMQSLVDLDLNKKIILPYEFMISNFHSFLHELLSYMDLSSLHASIYSSWSHEFAPIQDLSEDIVKGNVKSHKRTTDIYEWQKKIPKSVINDYLNKYPFLTEYQKLLDNYLQ